MKRTRISQGPWTRIRPLQRDEVDLYTHAGMTAGEITWGGFRNNQPNKLGSRRLCIISVGMPAPIWHE